MSAFCWRLLQFISDVDKSLGADAEGLTVVRFAAEPVEGLSLTPSHHSTAHHSLQESTMAVSHLLRHVSGTTPEAQ